MSKRRPAPARAPEFDAADVMARLKAGETVSIEDACKAATALGMRVELPPVRTTASPAHRARTELGRRLWELREQMAGAGVPMLDLDELTRETRERRGE